MLTVRDLRRVLQRLVQEERGAYAVLFVFVSVCVLFVMAFFVIDIGNLHEHRRHLQLQVDNGALSAGQEFTGCYQSPVPTNAAISATAHTYAGDPTSANAVNLQVEKPDRVAVGLNLGTYPAASGDGWNPALVNPIDPNSPCATEYLDVKATDRQVPTVLSALNWFGAGFVTLVDVKAKARVEIRKVQGLSGLLPWAVPDNEPKKVVALFVDEDLPNTSPPFRTLELSPQFLDANGNPTPQPLNGDSLAEYSSPTTIQAKTNTGIIILVSSVANPSYAGSLATICGQAGVACYHDKTPTSGLDFIHGWPSTSSGIALRDATLKNLDCTDQSAPYFQWNGGCNFKLRADIDFGGLAGTKTVTATGPGCNGGCVMAINGGQYETTGNISIADGSGLAVYSITATNRTTGGGPPVTTTGTFSNVQQAFAATDVPGPGYSGPVEYVGTTNSLDRGVQSNITVTVGLRPPLHVAKIGEPPILLRFASKSGSLNQALNCDDNQPGNPRSLADEVRTGCQTYYQVNNRGGVCPPWGSDPSYKLPPSTFLPPSGNLSDAPDCIRVKTGDVNAMGQGLHDRWEDPAAPAVACPPNNWPTQPNQSLPDSSDPRWVVLVVTDFSAFDGSGNEVVPITKFAGFYVTGWFKGKGNGSLPSGCATNGPPPNGAQPTDKSVKGDVWGYFVTDVPALPGATAKNEFCAFNEVGLCIAVLTQ